jgi:predicted ATPase/DNA-binding SARP family transcriptional activator
MASVTTVRDRAMDVSWRIELLGGLRVVQADRVITRFRRHKTGALLAYLAYNLHRSHRREELIELLWPASEPQAGHNRLRVALSSLRHQFEPPTSTPVAVLKADRELVQLNGDAVTTDVGEFHAARQSAAQARNITERAGWLAAAVERYGGELLPGYFEEWILPERQRLAEAYFDTLGELVAESEQAGDLKEAIQWARRAAGADPLREEAHHTLIRLLASAGRPQAACRYYRELEARLSTTCGAAPAPEIQEFVRALERQGVRSMRRAGETTRESLDPHLAQVAALRGVAHRTPLPQASTHPPLSSKASAVTPQEMRLPVPMTRFFGREEEIRQLRELLSLPDEGRTTPCLVTLTGPGGSGKTRLALAAAARLWSGFHGAVWFVPLADILDPRLIVDKLLELLSRYRSPGTEPWEQVTAFLLRQPTLLLLDNFEHLVSEGALVVRSLLDEVSTLTVLVTSRQRLGLAGERQFPVPLLPVPGDSGLWAVGSKESATGSDLPTAHCPLPIVAGCPSVQLFVERAQAVRPDFQLRPANAAAVVGLCRQLEGLPLALELAAARIGALTPAQMLSRLKPRFELLVSRQRDLAPRHRSLWSALDWSYQLLSSELQRFFARLSVFRGGWTLDAAEKICAGEGVGRWVSGVGEEDADTTPDVPDRTSNPHRPMPALDCLEQLRECSLVLAEEIGARRPALDSGEDLSERPTLPTGFREAEIRFRLLETLREYGAEQLTPAERSELARRHALHYLALAESAETEFTGPDQLAWLDQLEQEHQNFRAALDWCGEALGSRLSATSDDEPNLAAGREPRAESAWEIGLRLGGALGYFWSARGYWAEGRERLKQLLALPGAATRTTARAKVLRHAGVLVLARSEPEAARGLLAESVAIYRELGEPLGAAESLIGLGDAARNCGDDDAARACYEESLAINRSLGRQGGIAQAVFGLSEIARADGDLMTAVSLARQSLELYREIDNRRGIAFALIQLAVMVHHQADYMGARAYLEESLAIARELGDKPDIATALLNLGDVSRCLGDYAAAAAAYQERLELCRDLADEWGIAGTLNTLGIAAHRRDDHRRALALFTESIALYRELGSRPSTSGHDQELSVRYTSLCLAGLAGVSAERGQPEWAARILGAAAAALEAIDADLWPAERADFERSAAAVRDAASEAAFAACWAEGHALPLEQAILLALGEEPQLRRS